jgi:hypothetical protein
MKITGYGTIGQAPTTRRRDSAGGTGGSFAALLNNAGESQASSAAHETTSVGLEGLFSAQEVTDEELRRRKAIKNASSTLEVLEDIRLSILSGRLSPSRLASLGEAVSRQLLVVSDPALQSVLADIELRAAVELAKLEKAMETKK